MIAVSGPLRRIVARWGPRALVGLAAGVAAVAGSYAAVGFTPGFVVAPVAKFVTVTMPDAVVRFAITTLGDLGDQLALATAVGLSVGLLGAAATAGAVLARQAEVPRLAGPFAALGTVAVAAPITGSIESGVAAGIGAAVVVRVASIDPGPETGFAARRRVLASGVTALGAGLFGVALGHGRGPGPPADVVPSDGPDPDQRDLLSVADERTLAVGGVEPLVSEDFYEVDINQVDPAPSPDDWTFEVTGEVAESVTYDYDDLTGRPAEHRFVTLRCVGESLNGEKMDTALWTGVPVSDLTDPASPDAERVFVRAADGYYQEFPAAALDDALIAYEMNGDPLPRGHGFPARLLVPGHWGEINVKWVTEIEFRDENAEGYWEERGWHGTGPVETVAKLWIVDHLDDGRVEVGGHAYAGTRGVDRVEASTDGGDTWTEATLSDPLPGRVVDGERTTERATDAWRQWVHRYDPPDGSHDVVVRAVDRDGNLQPRDETGAFPSGATGWVSRTVEP